MADSTRVTVTWKDKFARVVKTAFYVASSIADPNNTTIKAIITLLQALSNATATEVAISASAEVAGTLTTTPYNSGQDKALFTVNYDTGNAANWKIPAPLAALFLADKYSLDPASSPVVALLAAIDTYTVSPAGITGDGTTVTGHRLMRKTLKR